MRISHTLTPLLRSVASRTACCILALCFSSALVPVAAYSQAVSCSYDHCGLRVIAGSSFGSPAIVRGVDAELVSRVGGRLKDSTLRLFSESPEAKAQIQIYNQSISRARWLRVVGLTLFTGGVVAGYATDQEAIGLGTGAVGIGLSLIGNNAQRRAHDALSEAVWWYNRQFTGQRTK